MNGISEFAKRHQQSGFDRPRDTYRTNERRVHYTFNVTPAKGENQRNAVRMPNKIKNDKVTQIAAHFFAANNYS